MMELTETTYSPRFSLSCGAAIYRDLHATVASGGLFKRSYLFYGLHSLFVVAALVAIAQQLVRASNLWAVAICAMGLSFCIGQIGGYMHDAAHMMIFKTKSANDLAGAVCGCLLFTNYNAWKNKHNSHHARPNQEGHDPDLEIPLFAFTTSRYRSKRGLARRLRRYQTFFYIPLLFLLALSLQFKNSIRFFIRSWKNKRRWPLLPEIILYLAGFFLWYVMPFIGLHAAKALVVVTVMPLATGLYIGSVFAPNHKGMPVIGNQTQLSFLEQQIVTSRNIKDNWLTDFCYLSLNYQIEHHLFPTCPRNKLKLITPHIRRLCDSHGLPFTVVRLRESFRLIMRSLQDVVEEAEMDMAKGGSAGLCQSENVPIAFEKN